MGAPISEYLTIESEDDLTKIVFGILQLLDVSVIERVLEEADISIRDETLEYTYHSKVDRSASRTPDLLLESATQTVMIEVKRRRNIDTDQLEDQLDDLRRHGNANSALLFISGHEERPPELIDGPLNEISWIGWRDVALVLLRHDFPDLSPTQARLLEVVVEKLHEEGYVPFTGFDQSLLEGIGETWSQYRSYFNEINTFVRAIEGRVDEHGLAAKNLWRDGISQDFHRFPSDWRFITDHFWVAFGSQGEEVNSKDGAYVFVALCWPEGALPTVRAGYSWTPGGRYGDADVLVDAADDIASFVESTEYRLIRTSRNFDEREAFVDRTQIQPVIGERETVEAFERVQLVADYDTPRLTDPAIVGDVAGDLEAIWLFVEEEIEG